MTHQGLLPVWVKNMAPPFDYGGARQTAYSHSESITSCMRIWMKRATKNAVVFLQNIYELSTSIEQRAGPNVFRALHHQERGHRFTNSGVCCGVFLCRLTNFSSTCSPHKLRCWSPQLSTIFSEVVIVNLSIAHGTMMICVICVTSARNETISHSPPHTTPTRSHTEEARETGRTGNAMCFLKPFPHLLRLGSGSDFPKRLNLTPAISIMTSCLANTSLIVFGMCVGCAGSSS